MADTFFFNGNLYTTPTAVTAVNSTGNVPSNQTAGNVLAIVGNANGGQPNTPIVFSDPNQVLGVLLGGDLAHAAIKAFNPSNDPNVGKPSQVVCVRVGEMTQGTLSLYDAQGHDTIDLVSTQYGTAGNMPSVMVAAGTVQGKQITVSQGGQNYVGNNLYQAMFQVQYSGTAPSADMTITATTLTLFAPAGTVAGTFPLATYNTVASLVAAMDALPGFNVEAIPASDDLPTLNYLDYCTQHDVMTAQYTATANAMACVAWLNGPAQNLVSATRNTTGGGQLVNIGPTYLSGATNPAPTNTDWSNAINVLQSQSIQHLVTLSTSPAIWAMGDAHCQFMSNQGASPRRHYSGPANGTSISAMEALPPSIDSSRTALCWPGHYDFNEQGVLQLYPCYMTALLVAASFAGAPPGTPMTNKTLTVQSLEYTANIPSDTDGLIQAGVCAVTSTSAGYVVVRSVSTWLADNTFNNVEISCGIATDFAMAAVQLDLKPLVGQPATPQLLARGLSIIDSTLAYLAKPAPNGPGVLVGDDNSPAFKGLQGSIQGDAVQFSWTMSPVVPANFVAGTATTVPYSGTATASLSS